MGPWPELRGRDGGEWSLQRELNFPMFRDLVRGMKPKAVGGSGFAASWLKLASDPVLQVFYSAVVSDLATDTLSARWHEAVLVLLDKTPPSKERDSPTPTRQPSLAGEGAPVPNKKKMCWNRV